MPTKNKHCGQLGLFHEENKVMWIWSQELTEEHGKDIFVRNSISKDGNEFRLKINIFNCDNVEQEPKSKNLFLRILRISQIS